MKAFSMKNFSFWKGPLTGELFNKLRSFIALTKEPRFWLLIMFLLSLVEPIRYSCLRSLQRVLSMVPGMQTLVPPPPKIITFSSLVPNQLFEPTATKIIDASGGTVELQNVARLEIPPGALVHPTQIKIIQVLHVEATNQRYSTIWVTDTPKGTLLPGDDFITPVVRLEPFGLKLKTPAKLYLPTDAARVGNNDPAIIKKRGSLSARNNDWFFDPFLESLGTPKNPVQPSIQSPIKIKYLVYVAKLFPSDIHSQQGAKVYYQHVDTSPTSKNK